MDEKFFFKFLGECLCTEYAIETISYRWYIKRLDLKILMCIKWNDSWFRLDHNALFI